MSSERVHKVLRLSLTTLMVATIIATLSIDGYSQVIVLKVRNAKLRSPIDSTIVDTVTQLLNTVYNSQEFWDSLSDKSFVCSNRPDMCSGNSEITGSAVFNELVSQDTLLIDLEVRKVGIMFWKRYFFETLGETDTNGKLVVTYDYWLESSNRKNLIIDYATHIGHELFHTAHFAFLHDPGFGKKGFIESKDVTYTIDHILESLLTKEMTKLRTK